jgi:hypothetical protein
MKPRTQFLALALVLAATAVGFVALYRLRLGQGDFFPAYSSLRSDPLGVRVLHDSLAALPGFRVGRWLQPFERLPDAPARTILVAGLAPEAWKECEVEEFAALDTAVRNGSRLVIAMRATRVTPEAKESKPLARGDREPPKDPEKPEQKEGFNPRRRPVDKVDEDEDEKDIYRKKPVFVNLADRWGVDVAERVLFDDARRGAIAPKELPESVRWGSDVYFQPGDGKGWRTIYRRGVEPVLVEKSHGLGSIVLAGDSYFLSNEALQRDRSVPLLAWTMGPHREVTFVEAHLGLMEDPGIAALAKRYGLGAAFFTLLLLAALFVWRRMALFVPPAEEVRNVALEYNQTAGLEALLRRAVPPAELATVCQAEWRATARAADIARVEAALAADTRKRPPAETYNVALRALRRR